MRVLVFRHVPFEGAGRIETAFKSRGIQFQYADLYKPGAPPPDVSGLDGVVVLGGPMSVNDDLPWLRKEERLVGQAIARELPVLGVCLGAQLVAGILGSAVRPNPVKEIGWYDITLSRSGLRDPLFCGFQERETVFHWHGETFDLPPGAILLARSEACAHQAYRVGSLIYGLQFHLEVTPEMIADWATHDENCGDVRELASPLDPHVNQPRATQLAEIVFGRWCDQVLQKSRA